MWQVDGPGHQGVTTFTTPHRGYPGEIGRPSDSEGWRAALFRATDVAASSTLPRRTCLLLASKRLVLALPRRPRAVSADIRQGRFAVLLKCIEASGRVVPYPTLRTAE